MHTTPEQRKALSEIEDLSIEYTGLEAKLHTLQQSNHHHQRDIMIQWVERDMADIYRRVSKLAFQLVQ